MNRLAKSVRHIQIKQIAYSPKLFEATITYEPHPTKYDENGYSKNPQKLIEMIKKHFFLTKEELDYDTMRCRFIP